MTPIKVKTEKIGRSTAKTKSKPKARQTTQEMKPASFDETGARIRAVLLELMCASESDSVRVAAAKALMDKLKNSGDANEDDEAQTNEDEQHRQAALEEARKLLAAFEQAKSNGSSCEDSVDADGAA